MGGRGNDANIKCGLTELLIFIAAIVSGTACSICKLISGDNTRLFDCNTSFRSCIFFNSTGSKTMMELKGEGITGEIEVFSKPIFQTFGMFVGMVFGLVMHFIVLAFKIPFPGYNHGPSSESNSDMPASETTVLVAKTGAAADEKEAPLSESLPVWMYFFLAIPSIFDLGATVLCMMGLQYIDVSIYQLLRGSGIIFVALMKQHVLGDALYKFQWVGVFWNVISVFLVGGTAILNESPEDGSAESGSALLGVMFVMAGAVVQAMQFVFEEKVMTMDIPSPPLLLIGMEGLWGTILCIFVVYPLAYFLPGDDHGSYEDFYNTWHMITHSPVIQYSFIVYFFGTRIMTRHVTSLSCNWSHASHFALQLSFSTISLPCW